MSRTYRRKGEKIDRSQFDGRTRSRGPDRWLDKDVSNWNWDKKCRTDGFSVVADWDDCAVHAPAQAWRKTERKQIEEGLRDHYESLA